MEIELRKQYFEMLDSEIRELVDPATGKLSLKHARFVDCPLCKASHQEYNEVLFEKRGYTFVRCQRCGMIYSNPQVKAELLNELYGTSKAVDLWLDIQISENERPDKKEAFDSTIEIIRKHAGAKGRILDIGTSDGYFIERVNEILPEWYAKGIDLNQKAIMYGRSKSINIEAVELRKVKERYNVFSLFYVLEHLPDPGPFIQEILEKAEEDEETYLMVVVPNAYSLYHMLLQANSVSFDGRNHLLYFSIDTLRRLMEQNGLEVVHCDTIQTGTGNIYRQMQWYPPNSDCQGLQFLPDKLLRMVETGEFEKFMLDNDLGLRIRMLARRKR